MPGFVGPFCTYPMGFGRKGDRKRASLFWIGITVCFIIICETACGNDNIASYWQDKGDDHYDYGNYELAVKCYDKAIEADNQSVEAWNKKGKALFQLDDKERDAIICYDEAIRIDPLFAGSWENRGKALDYIDKDDEALESYTRAKEIDDSIVIPPHLENKKSSETSLSWEKIGENLTPLIVFIVIYIIIILFYINFIKFEYLPKRRLFINWSKKYIFTRNFYMPLSILNFLKLLFLLAMLWAPLTYFYNTKDLFVEIIFEPIITLIFVTGLVLPIVAIGVIISIVLWLLFSPSLIPCGYRAIWAEFEQQTKNNKLLNRLNHFAIAYFLVVII